MRLQDMQNGWGNLYPELIMVDNSNIPFKCFHSYGNMSSVLPNTLTVSYMLQRRKSRIIWNHGAPKNQTSVCGSAYQKAYRPSRHGFYGRPMISGLLKGPKKVKVLCFSTERYIVVVNLTVTNNCHDEACPTHWSAMRRGPRAKRAKSKQKDLCQDIKF